MSSKRVADDFEDAWEREASINDNKKKQQQSNPYSQQADIVKEQYLELTNLYADLKKQLKELKFTLFELEEEEKRLWNESEELHEKYSKSLDDVISLIYKDTKGFLEDKVNYDAFIEKNNELSDQVLSLLKKWKQKLKQDEENNAEISKKNELDALISTFKRSELERIDLSIQIEGFSARIQLLQKETSKLNSLPQIPSMLETATNVYVETMKEISGKQEVIEHDSILPCLDRLVELKLTNILQQKHLKKDYDSLQAIIEDLQLAYRASLRQRAIQQLLTYIFDYEMQSKQNNLSVLEALTDDLEEKAYIKISTVDATTNAITDNNNNNNTNKNKQRYDSILDILDVNNLTSAVEKLGELQKKDEQTNSEWADGLQNYLLTIKELNDIQATLSSTLHHHSSTEAVPQEYLNLQHELESRLQELQSTISALEEDINNPENKAKFEKQKKLFSLFYTDANVFEQLYSEKK